MKIFDGVEVNPATLSPTWQGVLGVAMLFANSYIEADKIRTQRVAREHAQRQEPTTLSDVMEQSGLKIPHLHDALTAFMGGTEEAKDAATMIVNTPDPVKLLRDFVRQNTPASAANGPIIATPAPAPARPVSASPSSGAAGSSRPKPAAFRPEFTREGLEAAEKARAATPRPKPAAFRPEFTREGLEAAARACAAGASVPTAHAPTPARSLAEVLAERLEALTRKMDEHHAELDSRIRCAEAEIAALCEELQNLRVSSDRPSLFVVPSINEEELSAIEDTNSSPTATPSTEDVTLDEVSAVIASSADDVEALSAKSEKPTAGPDAQLDAAEQMSAEVHPTVDASVETACRVPDPPPLPPGTAEDLALAFSMLGKFTDQAEARYASEAERMRALERRLNHLRGLVEHSRGSAASHG